MIMMNNYDLAKYKKISIQTNKLSRIQTYHQTAIWI